MNIFELVKESMEVSVHLRVEKHGEEKVNAYDAKLRGNFQNAVLLKLAPGLRETFYVASEQQDIVDGTAYQDLRFPQIGAIPWDLEIGRVTVRMHDLDDEENDLLLTGMTADKFSFSMLEGGTVRLSLRVKLGAIDDEATIMKLLRANNQQLPVTLFQAELEEEPDNYDQVEQLTREPHSAARAEAESLFKLPPSTPESVVMDGAEYEDDDEADR